MRSRDDNAARYGGGRAMLVDRFRAIGGLNGSVEAPASIEARTATGRAVIYLRVSTEEQARVGGGAEGYSIPFQREACTRKAHDLGLTVVGTYIDPGYTATTIKRPNFKKMFEELADLGVTHLIVHKLDRLSRSPKVDYYVDSGLEAAHVSLVSVSEYVDDTPQGKLNLQIQRGVASYHSNNLGTEVIKGLTIKAKQGGTPGRAPLGYLNKRRYEDLSDIRWVEPDLDRAGHIVWAFEQYATGEWSIAQLADALERRGLRTRRTPKVPSRPVSIGTLHKLLVNPYYIGVVAYRGVYHEGTHEPLISVETWLRVQDVLRAHNTAGEKDRTHNNYLRGSIWCGHCGNRMVFSRNTGKGGTYEYFFCMGRRDRENRCPRGYTSVAKIEEGIELFYEQLHISADVAATIKAIVLDEMAHDQRQTALAAEKGQRDARRIEAEREKLLAAHYEGAIPLDMLKREMERFTRELHEAEKTIALAQASATDQQRVLDRSLDLIQHCHQLYRRAKPRERRMFNQGFFRRLYVGEDGQIEDAELQTPFAQLLARATDTRIVTDLTPRALPDTPSGTQNDADASPAPRGVIYHRTIHQERHDAVRLMFEQAKDVSGQRRTRRTLLCTAGSNNELLAEAEGFEPPVVSPTLAFKASAFGRSATLP